MLSNQYVAFCYSEQFMRILSHAFYSSHSAYYVWLCSFVKLKTLQLYDLEA